MERYERVLIDPQMAERFLAKNRINRTLKKNTVIQYAMDIKNGMWKPNNDPIAITKYGYLENGQHRLNAIIRSNTPVVMLVLFDAEPAMDTYDRGLPRSISDTLNIKFQQSGKLISSVTAKVAVVRKFLKLGFGIRKPSDEFLRRFIERYDGELSVVINASGTHGRTGALTRKASIQTALFCSYLCGVEEETLRDFCEIVNKGFQKEDWMTAPIVLRNEVMRRKYTNEGGSVEYLYSYTEYAINDFYRHIPRKRGYTITQLDKLPFLFKAVQIVSDKKLMEL